MLSTIISSMASIVCSMHPWVLFLMAYGICTQCDGMWWLHFIGKNEPGRSHGLHQSSRSMSTENCFAIIFRVNKYKKKCHENPWLSPEIIYKCWIWYIILYIYMSAGVDLPHESTVMSWDKMLKMGQHMSLSSTTSPSHMLHGAGISTNMCPKQNHPVL